MGNTGKLSAQAAIDRFKENEQRVQEFANDNASHYYVTNTDGSKVETLPHFMARIKDRYLKVLLRGDYAAGMTLGLNDVVKRPLDDTLWISTGSFTTSGNIEQDIADGNLSIWNASISDGVLYDSPHGGSVTRTVTGKLSDIVSVKDFGAKGDNATDDTAAIQAALDTGGEISFPPGKYRVTRPLTMQGDTILDGYGAELHFYNTSDDVKNLPVLMSLGRVESEIPLAANIVSSGQENPGTTIKTTSSHGLAVGDRVIIQTQRDTLSSDAGIWQLGTPTLLDGAATPTAWFAEVITVQSIINATTFTTTKQPVWPFYYAKQEPGVDVSSLARNASTIRKAHFLQTVQIIGLTIHCHSEASESYGNTILLAHCESPVIKDVSIIKHNGHGRGLAFLNCWNGIFDNCRVDNTRTYYPDKDAAHVYDNHMSIVNSWSCSAVNCGSINAGQSFDTTYGTPSFPGLGDVVCCPSIFVTIKNCVAEGAVDNSATNHSGCYMQTFEGCRFIGNARGMLIRSPYTSILGCHFSSHTDVSLPHLLHLAEPTLRGVKIIGNTFDGGDIAIRINPYVSRGAPPYRDLGIIITGNVVRNCKRAIHMDDWEYLYGSDGATVTELSKEKSNILISGNSLSQEKSSTGQLVRVGRYIHGVTISDNQLEASGTTSTIAFYGYNMHCKIINNSSTISGEYPLSNIPAHLPDDATGKQFDANLNTYNEFYGNSTLGAPISSGSPRYGIRNPEKMPIAIGSAHSFVDCSLQSASSLVYKVRDTAHSARFGFERAMSQASTGFHAHLVEGEEYLCALVAGAAQVRVRRTAFQPETDNTHSLGMGSRRWTQLFASSGTINTSDERKKRDITSVPEALLEAWAEVKPKLFRFSDGTRTHVGFVAQDIDRAFTARGLLPGEYGFFCYDEWPDKPAVYETVAEIEKEAVCDGDGNLVSPETFRNVQIEAEPASIGGSLYGIRYEEALVLEAAYQRWRYGKLVARVEALEQAVGAATPRL